MAGCDWRRMGVGMLSRWEGLRRVKESVCQLKVAWLMASANCACPDCVSGQWSIHHLAGLAAMLLLGCLGESAIEFQDLRKQGLRHKRHGPKGTFRGPEPAATGHDCRDILSIAGLPSRKCGRREPVFDSQRGSAIGPGRISWASLDGGSPGGGGILPASFVGKYASVRGSIGVRTRAVVNDPSREMVGRIIPSASERETFVHGTRISWMTKRQFMARLHRDLLVGHGANPWAMTPGPCALPYLSPIVARILELAPLSSNGLSRSTGSAE